MFVGIEYAPEIIAKFYNKEIAENPSCSNEVMTKNLAMLEEFVNFVVEPCFEKKIEDANKEGYNEGYRDGHTEGYEEGYDEGRVAGFQEYEEEAIKE